MPAILHLSSLDLAKNELQNPRLHQLSAAPSNPVTGQVYYNTTDNVLYWYNGSAWISAQTASYGSVTSETSYGLSASNGVAATASRSDHTHGTPTHGASDHSAIKISDLAAPVANVSWGTSYKITNLADPSSAQDAATKAYVDSVASGLTDFKQSVRAASTANVTLASGAQNGSSFGGVTLATGDRILLAGQTDPAENGIYTVNATGAPTRATDMDANGELSVGTVVYAESGTNGSTQFVCSATGATPWTTSTSSTWVVFQTIASAEAGAGLTQNGGVLDVGAGTGISVSADSVAVDTSVVTRKHIPGTGPASDATSWAITHNLGNRDVLVQVYDATTYAQVVCDITRTSTTVVTLNFASTVTANTLRAVVIG